MKAISLGPRGLWYVVPDCCHMLVVVVPLPVVAVVLVIVLELMAM